MMKMMKTPIATERSDLQRLVSTAIKEANSQSVERCLDIVRYLKSLRLASKDIRKFSREIHPLDNLRNHGNPKIRKGAHDLFDSWMKTLYSSGREEADSNCNNNNKAFQKSHAVDDDKACTDQLKKKKKEDGTENPRFLPLKRVRDVTCKYAPKRIRLQPTTQTKPDDTFTTTMAINQAKKQQTTLPSKLSDENPSFGSYETGSIKRNLKMIKPDVSANPKYCPALKKNATEMLELFDIAKKSADVANTKGLLAAKRETSICVDTLALLIDFPISATAPETRKIMEKLEHLTRHKDRKVCNSASTLLHHWRQSIIRDQQQHGEDAPKNS